MCSGDEVVRLQDARNKELSEAIEVADVQMVPPHVCYGLMCAMCRIAKAVHILNEADPIELETCPRCGGAGQYHWDSECEICEGTGMVDK